MVNWNVHGLAAENECRNNKSQEGGMGYQEKLV
jgi:hypothetical protein